MLFYMNDEDQCNSTTRCDRAAAAGAIGCLLYNSDNSIGLPFLLTYFLIDLNLQDQRTFPVEVLLWMMV